MHRSLYRWGCGLAVHMHWTCFLVFIWEMWVWIWPAFFTLFQPKDLLVVVIIGGGSSFSSSEYFLILLKYLFCLKFLLFISLLFIKNNSFFNLKIFILFFLLWIISYFIKVFIFLIYHVIFYFIKVDFCLVLLLFIFLHVFLFLIKIFSILLFKFLFKHERNTYRCTQHIAKMKSFVCVSHLSTHSVASLLHPL